MFGVSSALGKGLENSLDAVLQLTQESLDQVEAKKNKPSSSSSITSNTSYGGTASSPYYGNSLRASWSSQQPTVAAAGGGTGRSVSTSRLATAPALASIGTAYEYNPSPLPRPSSSIRNGDRKYDMVLKKLRFMEEKVKKLENTSLTQQNLLTDCRQQQEKVIEGAKAEKKVVLSLKDQLSSLKTRVDLLLNQDELRDRLQHEGGGGGGGSGGRGRGLDMSQVENYVTMRIHHDVQAMVEDFCQRQLNYLTKQDLLAKTNTTSNTTSTSATPVPSATTGQQSLNHKVLDDLHEMEREILRLRSEQDRLRNKQSYLDKIYSDLKDSVSTKEMDYEKKFKRSLASTRDEISSLHRQAEEKIRETLTVLERSDSELEKVREDLEGQTRVMAQVMADFDQRLVQQENTSLSFENQLGLIKAKEIVELSSQMEEMEKKMKEDRELLLLLPHHQEVVKQFDHNFHDIEQWIQTFQLDQQQEKQYVESCLTKQNEKIIKEMENQQNENKERLDSYHRQQEEQQKQVLSSLDILYKSQLKLKGKMKSHQEELEQLRGLRSGFDMLTKEFSDRLHEESKGLVMTQNSVQRLEEEMIVKIEEVKRDMVDREMMEKRLSGVDEQFKDLSRGK
eukprot:gene10635-11789_t